MNTESLKYMKEKVVRGEKLNETIYKLKTFRDEVFSEDEKALMDIIMQNKNGKSFLGHILRGTYIAERFKETINEVLTEIIKEYEKEFKNL